MSRIIVLLLLAGFLAACQAIPATPTPAAQVGRPTRVPPTQTVEGQPAPTSTAWSLSGSTAQPGVPTVTAQPLAVATHPPQPTVPAPTLAAPTAEVPMAAGPLPPLRPEGCALLPQARRLPGLRLGVALRANDDLAAQVERAASLGAHWASLPVSWAALEPERGQLRLAPLDAQINLLTQAAIGPIVVLHDVPAWAAGKDVLPQDPADLAAFATALATRYQGRVRAYQLWDLPNVAAGGRPAARPDRYAEALVAGATAVRAADPCALIFAGGLLPNRGTDATVALDDLVYYQRLVAYNDGAARAAYDALAVPLLTGDVAPGSHSKNQDERFRRFTYLERLRNELVYQGEADKQLWVSLGWPLAAGGPETESVDPDEQAEFLQKAFERTSERHPWVATLLVRDLSARPPDPGMPDYRIVRDDGSLLPAFEELSDWKPQRLPGARSGFSGPENLGLLWIYRGPERPAPGATVAADGSLHIASSGQWSHTIDANGAFRWSYRLGGQQATTGLTVDAEGATYLGSNKNLLVAVAPDSRTRWDLLLPEPVTQPPTVAGGVVYVPLNSALAAVSAANGELLWLATLPGKPGRVGMGSDGTAYLGTTDNRLHAIRAGVVVWSADTAAWVRGAPLVLADGTVVAANDRGTVWAFDAAGRVRWSFAGSGALAATPVLGGDGTLYVPSSEGLLYALDPNGNLRWQASVPGPATLAAAVAENGTIVVASGSTLSAFDPLGNLRWRFEADERLVVAPQIAGDGIVITGDDEGTIYGLGVLALRERLGWP